MTVEGVFYLTEIEENKTKCQWVETLNFPFYLGGPLGEVFGGVILNYIWKKNLKNLKEIIE